MKNFKTILAILFISTGLMSCSSEEIFTPEETSNKLLESYTVKRDAKGAYSLDYNLANNATASLSTDKKSNSNDFYLYSSDNQSRKNFEEALAIQNNALKVGFTDTENGKKSSMTIMDNDISFSRNADEDFLTDYSVTNNGDGTVSLDFNVADDVAVNFIYNGDTNTYEIHMEDGASSQTNFNQTYAKEEGVPLKIDFVNNSGGETSRTQTTIKPRVIVDETEEEDD
ncbi:MAG: hypothetical protein JXQ93_04470 [Flavobacteriaceae bacterium]